MFGIEDPGVVGLDYEMLEETSMEIELGDNPAFEQQFIKDAFYNLQGQRWVTANEVLYWDPEFNPGIMGMIVNRTHYDSDLIRVLSVLHPRYQRSGWIEIEPWDWDGDSYDTWSYKRNMTSKGKLPSCGDITFQKEWFYPATIELHYMWPVHAYCARHLFQSIGLDFDHKDYRLFFAWHWR